MAQCKQEKGTHKFVILGVKDGVGFGYLKNKLMRILVEFEEKTLSSEQFYVTPAPYFNCNFTWHVENSLLKRLQSVRTNITIELKILEEGAAEERSVGFATIGLRHAQYITSFDDSPRFRSLQLKGVKLPFGVRNPNIFVALTIQSHVFIKAAEECHSTDLEDPLDKITESSENVCDPIINREDWSNKSQTNIKKTLKKNKPMEQTESRRDINSQASGIGASTSKSAYSTDKSALTSTKSHYDGSIRIEPESRRDINSQASGIGASTSKSAYSTDKSALTSTKSHYDGSTRIEPESRRDINSQASGIGASTSKSAYSTDKSALTSTKSHYDGSIRIEPESRRDINSQASGIGASTSKSAYSIDKSALTSTKSHYDGSTRIEPESRRDINSQASGIGASTSKSAYSTDKSALTLTKSHYDGSTRIEPESRRDINSQASGIGASTSKSAYFIDKSALTATKSHYDESVQIKPSCSASTAATSYVNEGQTTTSYDESGWTDRTTTTSGVLDTHTPESMSTSRFMSMLRNKYGVSYREFAECDNSQNTTGDNISLPLQPSEWPVTATSGNLDTQIPESISTSRLFSMLHSGNGNSSREFVVYDKSQNTAGDNISLPFQPPEGPVTARSGNLDTHIPESISTSRLISMLHSGNGKSSREFVPSEGPVTAISGNLNTHIPESISTSRLISMLHSGNGKSSREFVVCDNSQNTAGALPLQLPEEPVTATSGNLDTHIPESISTSRLISMLHSENGKSYREFVPPEGPVTPTSGNLDTHIPESISTSRLISMLHSENENSSRKFVVGDNAQNTASDNINLPLQPPEDQKPWSLDYTEDKTPTATTCISKKPEDKESKHYHIYKLELKVISSEWFKRINTMKVTIKFYNPHCKSKVTVKNQDYYLPKLLMSDIICCMYYVSQPQKVYDVMMYQPPQVLFYRKDKKLCARAILNVTNLERQPQSDILETHIPVTAENNAIIGGLHVLIKFKDLGLASKNTKAELECVIKKEPPSDKNTMQDISVEDVISDLEQLASIHEKLRHTFKKMNTCFQKMLKAQGLEHISEHDQAAQASSATTSNENVYETDSENNLNENENVLWCEFCNEFHLVKKTSDYITSIEETPPQQQKSKEVKQEAKLSNKFSKQTTASQSVGIHKLDNQFKKEKHEIGSKQQAQDSKQGKHSNARSLKAASVETIKPTIQSKPRQMDYIPEPAITVVNHPCQGCEQYLEVGYGQRVWQDDELKFWCKDCCIRRLQSELKETMQNCTLEVSDLKNQIKTLEDEFADFAANSVSKNKYEYLSAAQHNLTMLLMHANDQNENLHMQCSETAAKLEELKQSIPQETPLFKITQNENQFYKDKEKMKEVYDRVRELKQEIDSYRNKDDTPKQTKEDPKERVAAFTKPIKKSEQTLSARRDRCEACRILHDQAKTTEIKKSKTRQTSVPQQIKSVISSRDNLHKKDEEIKEKATASSSSFCEHYLRERMAAVHAKLQHYLEERDELVRVNHYTCENTLVSYMTKTINKLLIEWNELKTELENLSQ